MKIKTHLCIECYASMLPRKYGYMCSNSVCKRYGLLALLAVDNEGFYEIDV